MQYGNKVERSKYAKKIKELKKIHCTSLTEIIVPIIGTTSLTHFTNLVSKKVLVNKYQNKSKIAQFLRYLNN